MGSRVVHFIDKFIARVYSVRIRYRHSAITPLILKTRNFINRITNILFENLGSRN